MGRNGVKVIIRTRPTASFATHQLQIDPDDSTITVFSGAAAIAAASGGLSPSKTDGGPSNRKDLVDGVNGTILAYGQTGAGKSFTMIGDTRNYQHRGIAPRSIAQLFEEVENRIELQYTVRVSYMEIYNDRIYDLLEGQQGGDRGTGGGSGELVVVEDARGTYVRGLTQVEVHSEQEALDQLFNGELQRTVAEHQLNKRSNRSHCVLTFHIAQKSRAGGTERVTLSKLHLVDLAGSERLKKTLDGTSLGGNSNTLMFACIWGEGRHLEETISTLKLAQRMMRVQNEVSTIVETDPALLLRKYERQIRELKHELVMHDALVERTAVVYDEHTPEQKHQLLQMVRRYVDAPSQEMEDEALRLTSVHEIRELFRQFKLLVKSSGLDFMSEGASSGMNGPRGSANSNNSVRSGSAGSSASRTQTSTGSRDDLRLHAAHGPNGEALVGEEEPDAIGFPLGLVPGAARPSTMDTGKKKDFRAAGGTAGGPSPTANAQRSLSASRSPSGAELPGVSDNNEDDRDDDYGLTGAGGNGDGATLAQDAETRAKNDAFQFYRSAGPGRKLHHNLQEEKDKLFDAKQRVKQVTRRVNAAKAQIDAVRAQLEDKRNQRKADGGRKGGAKQVEHERDEVVDEEEFILMTAEREAKRDYRSLFGDLKDAKAELEFSLRSVELLRRRLVREFEDWTCVSKDDKLDDGEKFDQMEVDRIRAQDPDSLAFFQAQKKMRQQAGAIVPASQRKAKR
ncbi:hypothetical protein KRP22_009628 [Phytophthora ramorum]|nr:Kinesin-like protein KLP1 [Phytophthora ramorum]